MASGTRSDESPVLSHSPRARATMPPPNLLLILTDQQTAGAMGCAGEPDLATPAMDRLAAGGVRFERAYCTQPLCVPSRASLVTGRMPSEVGVPINMKGDEPRARRSWAFPWMGLVLAEAGYETAWIGKWHLPTPVERTDVHGFAHTEHARANRLDPDVPPACEAFLQQPRDRPFFMVASFVNPHDICQWARGEAMLNDEIDAPPPPEHCPPLPDNFAVPEGEPPLLRNEVQPFTPRAYPTGDWPAGTWRQYRWAYHRLVERVDHHVGRVLNALDAAGRGQDTVVIFTSDHGDGVGAHRWNQKQVLYEEVARVPMVVRDPSAPGGRVNEQHLVSMNLDLLPTLCDYADHAPPTGLAGRSLRPLVAGGADPAWREAVVCETEFCSFGADQTSGIRGRMVRTARYKYIVYQKPEHDPREQLFDLLTDPGEMHDLSTDPDHAGVLASLKAREAARV